jgi:hypothetical protein
MDKKRKGLPARDSHRSDIKQASKKSKDNEDDSSRGVNHLPQKKQLSFLGSLHLDEYASSDDDSSEEDFDGGKYNKYGSDSDDIKTKINQYNQVGLEGRS